MAVLDDLGVPRETPAVGPRDNGSGERQVLRRLSLVERIERLGDRGRSVPALMGAKQVATALGTTTSNLQFVRDLPEHVAELPNGRLWLAEDITEFAKTRTRRGPRTAKAVAKEFGITPERG